MPTCDQVNVVGGGVAPGKRGLFGDPVAVTVACVRPGCFGPVEVAVDVDDHVGASVGHFDGDCAVVTYPLGLVIDATGATAEPDGSLKVSVVPSSDRAR